MTRKHLIQYNSLSPSGAPGLGQLRIDCLDLASVRRTGFIYKSLESLCAIGPLIPRGNIILTRNKLLLRVEVILDFKFLKTSN